MYAKTRPEDTSLALATNDSVDSILFYVAFELDTNRVISRQFESGYFENGALSKMKEIFGYKCVAPVYM